MTYSDVSRKKPELIFRDEVRPLRFRWDLTLFPAAAGGGPPGSDQSIRPRKLFHPKESESIPVYS